MFEHVVVSAFGGIVGVVTLVALAMFVNFWSFYSRIKWKDDAPLLGKAREAVHYGSLHVYKKTRWRGVASYIPHAMVVGAAVTWVGSLVWVGFTHVYL